MSIPVALFTYKRPVHTKATLDALAANTIALQTDLYIFSDGPKNENDTNAVESVRELIREVKGFASVTITERATNMGLAQSIITGTSELFTKFEAVIVLEDDLVTTKHFLSYMNEALYHYRDDSFAFSITGHTFTERALKIKEDYQYDTYAAFRCSSSSWGTWRDRWARVDWDMHYFECFCKDAEAQDDFNQGGGDLSEMLRMQYRGQIDSWAIRFCYAHSANKMMCIYPVKTLVKNIGMDNSGTHTGHDPHFDHLVLDAAWQPRKFCPAANPDPEVMKRFRAIWDPPVARNINPHYSAIKSRLVSILKRLRKLTQSS